MFIKKTKARSGRNTHTYLQLVESVWRDGRPTHRMVASLGREDKLDPAQVDRLIASLAPYGKAQMVTPEAIRIIGARQYGTVYALQEVWRRLGLDEVFRDLAAKRSFGFDAEAAVRAIVFSRVVDPRSERATVRWLGQVHAPDLTGLKLQHLYRCLDFVSEVQDEVQSQLFQRVTQRLVGELRLVLFDTTSVYFEGEGPAGLARYGFSRDKRSDQPQVILGLFTSQEGYPLFHSVFPGNTSDITSFRESMGQLKARLPVSRIVMVMDRGTVSDSNLDNLRAGGVGYIAGTRLRHLATQEALSVAGRYHVVEHNLQVKEVKCSGKDRYIVCYNPEEARNDRREREAMVAGLEAELSKGVRSLFRNQVARRYLVIEGAEVRINRERIRDDARYDGKWVLQTNTDLPAEEVARAYKGLWQVENAFRTIKNPLELRPIYHWSEPRVRAHISLCVVAYLLERVMDVALAKADLKMTTQEAVEELAQISMCEVKAGGKRLMGATTLTDRQRAVLRALGVPEPPALESLADIVTN